MELIPEAIPYLTGVLLGLFLWIGSAPFHTGHADRFPTQGLVSAPGF